MPVTPIVNQDPQYSDSASKNFHIGSSSPCYDVAGDIAQTVDDGGGPTDEQASADQESPNVLFIITDDQRADGTITQSQDPQVIMPEVVDQLKKTGTDYSNAFVSTPLCCPSRASIMSGRYAHNHVVSNNFGAWNFDEDPTLQAYLHDEAGYRTGIFGKYLNDWDLLRNPAHWDTWGIFNNGYCPFRVNEDGSINDYGVFNKPNDRAVRRLHHELRARQGPQLHRPGRERTTRSRGSSTSRRSHRTARRRRTTSTRTPTSARWRGGPSTTRARTTRPTRSPTSPTGSRAAFDPATRSRRRPARASCAR